MQWIAPSEKDTATDTLEKRLWDAADQLRARQQMIEHGVLEVVDAETLRFTKDQIFPSPSQAAAVVLGRNANGWTEWKYPDGHTLDDVKRKTVDS